MNFYESYAHINHQIYARSHKYASQVSNYSFQQVIVEDYI